MKLTNDIMTADKVLKEIAFDMHVLLVEDDLILQQQLKVFLSRFFGSVDTADHGVDALEKYENKRYDLIVTDLTMPYMDGIELARRIKEINYAQHILVVSAHSDSNKLIELINIGTDGFILKPIEMGLVIKRLSRTCQAIYDHNMLEFFNNMLEETNQELKETNMELEYTLFKLGEVKETIKEAEPEEASEQSEKVSAQEYHTIYPFELDMTNEKLEDIEDSFNLMIVNADGNLNNYETLSALMQLINEYLQELELIPRFEKLTDEIQKLQKTFPFFNEPSKLSEIIPMITSLFDNLENWRKGVFFYKNVEDIHFMDKYIIKDTQRLQKFMAPEKEI